MAFKHSLAKSAFTIIWILDLYKIGKLCFRDNCSKWFNLNFKTYKFTRIMTTLDYRSIKYYNINIINIIHEIYVQLKMVYVL